MIYRILIFFIAAMASALAQNSAVQAGTATHIVAAPSGTLHFGNGYTVYIDSGGTIINNGTATGFGSGYTLPAATTTTLGGVIVPTAGGIVVDGSGNISFPPATPTSFGGVIVPSTSGLTIDGSGNLSASYSLKLLDGSGDIVVQGSNQQLLLPTGTLSVDWYNHTLNDGSGTANVDWQNKRLSSGGNIQVNWLTDILTDGSNVASLSWNTRQLKNTSGANLTGIVSEASGHWANATASDTASALIGSTVTVSGTPSSSTVLNGAGAWTALPSAGVTSIAASSGITATPSPITGTGNLTLSTIATGNVLANTSGSTAAPTATSVSTLLAAYGTVSVSNSDGSLTVSPTTNNVVASINLAHGNTWTASQTNQTTAYFGTNGLGYADTGIAVQKVATVGGYYQDIQQNNSSATNASADYIVGNNLTSATNYYGDFFINSSTFTGTGAFNQTNAVGLTATGGDLALGTTSANATHIVSNSAATDAITVQTNNGVVFPTAGTASTPVAWVKGAPYAGTSANSLPAFYVRNSTNAAPTLATGGTQFAIYPNTGFSGDYADIWNPSGTSLFKINGSGATITFNLQTTNLGFTSSSQIAAPSNGIIELLNNAGTSLTRLDLGGTTSSFPALAPSGTTLKVVLADGSADTTIEVGGLNVKAGTSSGTVTLTAGSGTITSAAITTSSVIILSLKTSSGTPGLYMPGSTVSSGSATVTGLATDNSTYNYAVLNVNQ